jgi:hypothetical protein
MPDPSFDIDKEPSRPSARSRHLRTDIDAPRQPTYKSPHALARSALSTCVLSIGKLGQGQADYYLETVAQGAEDY